MENIIISLLLATPAALIVYLRKNVTFYGALIGWLMTITITYIGGVKSFLLVLLTFLAAIITKRFKNKNNSEEIIKKTKAKDGYQIIANLFVPTISLIIYSTTENIVFMIAFLTTIGEALSDTLGSDVGVLSRGFNRDIVTLKPIPKGLSGGISLLGTTASIIGAIIIGILSYYAFNISLIPSIYISGIIFIGTLIDSFLGSTIQAKYRCPKCRIITEKEIHCNKKCRLAKGIRLINNDAVNLFTSIITFIITLLIL